MSKQYKTLAAMNSEMLQKKRGEIEKELVKLRGQAATGASQKNPYALRNNRCAIARILTLVQERGKEQKEEKIAGVTGKKEKTGKGDEQA